MVKVHVDNFYSVSNMTVDDVIEDISGGFSECDIFNLTIKTFDKYHHVETNATTYSPDFSGPVIELYPYGNNGDVLDPDDPNYYHVKLIVEGIGTQVAVKATKLKYEYVVMFIPDSLIYNDCRFDDVDVIEWEIEA